MALIVNGEKVEDSQIKKEVERLRPEYERVFAHQSPEQREAQLLDWSKENIIERVLIKQEAEKNGYKISNETVDSLLAGMKKDYKNQQQLYKDFNAQNDEEVKKAIRLMVTIDRLFQDIYKMVPKPTKEAVLKYYQENKEQFRTEEKIRVAHIVKHVNWQTDEATAENLIRKAQNELKNGAAFETLVTKYSDCPENGGDLGYIIRGKMVEEFDDVVFNLAVGQVSGVFRTRFGFHIAKVYDRKPAAVPALEQIRTEVVDALRQQMREEAVNDFIDRLKTKAQIEQVL